MTEKNHQHNSLQAIALLGKMSAMQLAMEVVELRAHIQANPALKEWRMMSGDWRDELVSLHGQNGHIVSGLTVAQAQAIIDAHGGVNPSAAMAQTHG